MKLATYVIGQGDTIEILAQNLLGDMTQDQTLIQINNLRYPYISDNPMDQYARPKGHIFLNGSFTNPQTITINNPNSIVIHPNDTVFLLEGSSNASGVISSVTNNSIEFKGAISGTFDQAAIVTVFSNQENVTSQVLRTGDTLFYPADQTQASNSSSSYNLMFGTDWKLDNNGFLEKVNGDIATISGIGNLGQALTMRFETPLGALMLHVDYGNQLFDVLGEASQTYFVGLAKYYITECAKQDIRVSDVTISDLTIVNDSVYGTLTVIPNGSQNPITQPIQIQIGGV